MGDKFAVEETKDLLDFLLTFGGTTYTALSDGFQITDITTILPTFVKLPAAINGAGQIPDELKELDAEERQELYQFVQDKFDIPNDQLEAVIERTLKLGAELASFVFFIRNQGGLKT